MNNESATEPQLKKLKKGCYFTDLHFGKKSNSPIHNTDCLDFLKWFCASVKADPTIDYVAFLGDWNENRSSIHISTLNFSMEGAKLLNDLGIPVYFVVGNHDLFYRNSREIHSIITFEEFSNFVIIDEPTIINEIEGGMLFSPYMFHPEYPNLTQFLNVPVWAGHFEFQGFVVTGTGIKMPHGPSASDFKGPKRIFSGHFHKRQTQDNIHYIGNTFPMDFSDAGDNERGLMIYDHVADSMTFKDWADCPKYVKISLTQLLERKTDLPAKAHVKCIVDVPITYEESVALQQTYTKNGDLREFKLEESDDLRNSLKGTEISEEVQDAELSSDSGGSTVDELVIKMITGIDSDMIDNSILIDLYNKLNT